MNKWTALRFYCFGEAINSVGDRHDLSDRLFYAYALFRVWIPGKAFYREDQKMAVYWSSLNFWLIDDPAIKKWTQRKATVK
jgi:hypothetical protein